MQGACAVSHRVAAAEARPLGRGAFGGVLVALAASVAAPCGAANWVFNPGVTLVGTYTDNVDLQPRDLARDDAVMQLTPSLTFRGQGAHAEVAGSVALPVLAYARTGSENNDVYPLASILGRAEVVDDLFFVEGAIYVTQPYENAFGSHSTSLVSGNDNRFTAASYRLSPYVKGELPGDMSYEVRNDAIWTSTHDAPPDVNDAFSNHFGAHIARVAAPLGWFADLDLEHVKFSDQGWQRINLARIGPRYAISPQLRVQASAGYENDEFPLASYHAVLYGAAIEWRPSERTTAYANVEHRFFGTSYLASLDYRTPLTVWSIVASRDLSNFSSALAGGQQALGVGTLLDRLFKSRIPDPLLRRQAVDQYIQQQALPTTLNAPVNFYSQEILLTNRVAATAGFTGSRNSLFFTAHYERNRGIEGSSGTPTDPLTSGSNNTQYGLDATFSHRLTPVLGVNVSMSLARTDAAAPAEGRTNQGGAGIELNRALSQHTRVFVGTRYQRLTSDVTDSYRETAYYAGIGYTFR